MKTLLLVALLTTLALAQEDVTEEVPDTALDLRSVLRILMGLQQKLLKKMMDRNHPRSSTPEVDLFKAGK